MGIKYKVLMVLMVAALTLIPLSCVQPQESAGILFGFHGGGVTCEPATETMVQIAIAHTCEVNDELILKKVEIYGEGETPVKVFEVNKTLNSILGKQKRLDELFELLESGMEDEAKYEEIDQEAAKLAQEIRDESFSTEYFTLDLRQLKQSLMVGDKIPIIARATLIHNGNLLTLERSVIAEYQASLPGSH